MASGTSSTWLRPPAERSDPGFVDIEADRRESYPRERHGEREAHVPEADDDHDHVASSDAVRELRSRRAPLGHRGQRQWAVDSGEGQKPG